MRGKDAVGLHQARLQKSEEIIKLVGKGLGAKDLALVSLALEPYTVSGLAAFNRDLGARLFSTGVKWRVDVDQVYTGIREGS
jgi:hypothetical protein